MHRKDYFFSKGQSLVRVVVIVIIIGLIITSGLYFYFSKQISTAPEITKNSNQKETTKNPIQEETIDPNTSVVQIIPEVTERPAQEESIYSNAPTNIFINEPIPYVFPANAEIHKLLIVEFVPQNIKYASMHFCSDGSITHTADDEYGNLSNQPRGCNSLESHNFLEIINNPAELFTPPVQLLSNLFAINTHSYAYINRYLSREASKYQGATPIQFELDIKGPIILNECPPSGSGLPGEVGGRINLNYFKDKLQNEGIQTDSYDFVAITYIDPISLSKNSCPKYTNQAFLSENYVFTSIDSGGVGNEFHLITMTHEILHLFGVSDTYVSPANSGGPSWCHIIGGCAADPEGVPIPGEYPQLGGCLMSGGREVFSKGTSELELRSIDNVYICIETARKLEWID
ncbi:hypothetical protein IID24_04490 [Patescibacteria group bacterium]|nr:hypothetical protein [Patescibacteria group bacterium]